MIDLEEIRAKLVDAGLDVVGQLVSDYNSDSRAPVFAFVKVEKLSNGRLHPSSFSLKKLARRISKDEFRLEFVHVDDNSRDVEGSVKALLIRRFGHVVRNVFVSENGNDTNVWIEPKGTLSEAAASSMQDALAELFDVLGERLGYVKITNVENLPTPTACLNGIRTYSPVDVSTLISKLEARGFSVPSEAWMLKLLDKSRKRKLVHRLKNGHFMVTPLGLSILGSRKDRKSPDIVRALDLARRGH